MRPVNRASQHDPPLQNHPQHAPPPSPSHPRPRMNKGLRCCVVTHQALEVVVTGYGSSFSTAVRLCTPWWSRSTANTSQRYCPWSRAIGTIFCHLDRHERHAQRNRVHASESGPRGREAGWSAVAQATHSSGPLSATSLLRTWLNVRKIERIQTWPRDCNCCPFLLAS